MRLERLTSAFLDFARPPQPAKRPADLRPVVAETLELVARRAALQSVRLRPELPPAPAVADVDPGQLRQVLLNLFLNALEASPVGGSVRVELAAGPGAVELRVADEGPGPPEGLGERIFEPFVSTKETGVGLGLSICRRVVEAHGGTLTAARGPAGGAVFTVALPPPGEPEEKAWQAC